MKLLANENFPLLAVKALQDLGHDVLWARTDMRGEADDVILHRAQAEDRLVVTFDKDFGELAFPVGTTRKLWRNSVPFANPVTRLRAKSRRGNFGCAR